jgi:hypothetical protein
MLSKIKHWCSSIFIRWLTSVRPYEGVPLCDFERIRYEIRPGDVILIEGRSRVSDIIRAITQSSWSHAALYIGHLHDIEDPKIRNLVSLHYQGLPDEQLVIEGIMGKGARVNKLSYYEKDHIRLCRPKGLSRIDAQKIIALTTYKLGSEYDVRQVLDLARFLLPWSIMPRRLRSKLFEFQAQESTKTVCASMIAEAFSAVDFPILPLVQKNAEHKLELITRNPKLYTPRDFDYSPYFDIIKYPFVEFSYAIYHKLPWNREGLISHDRVGVYAPQKIKKKKLSAMKRLREKLSGKKNEEILEEKLGETLAKSVKTNDLNQSQNI